MPDGRLRHLAIGAIPADGITMHALPLDDPGTQHWRGLPVPATSRAARSSALSHLLDLVSDNLIDAEFRELADLRVAKSGVSGAADSRVSGDRGWKQP